MKIQFRIAFACALGAIIGTFVALQFTFYFAWIGPLAYVRLFGARAFDKGNFSA